jgi:phosphatidylinositol glycan class Z
MYILRWLWEGFGYDVSPSVVYWTLRVLMLALSVVMEDWAVHELVESPRARRVAVPLVASSYVTWTFQTHTFSNSIETLLVSWSLVLIQRIVGDKVRTLAVRFPFWSAANPRCRSALASSRLQCWASCSLSESSTA